MLLAIFKVMPPMWLSARDIYEIAVGHGYDIQIHNVASCLSNMVRRGTIKSKRSEYRNNGTLYLVRE